MVRTIGNDLLGSGIPRTIALRALQTYRVRVFSSTFRTGSEHKKKEETTNHTESPPRSRYG